MTVLVCQWNHPFSSGNLEMAWVRKRWFRRGRDWLRLNPSHTGWKMPKIMISGTSAISRTYDELADPSSYVNDEGGCIFA